MKDHASILFSAYQHGRNILQWEFSELQGTELKNIINFTKELKDFKDHIKTQVGKIKEKELMEIKYPRFTQENTNIRLVEMIKTILDLRRGFIKEVESLKRTQDENEIE